MSVTYVPCKHRGVAKTPWSYKGGGFDANVDGMQWLGHETVFLTACGQLVDPAFVVALAQDASCPGCVS